TGWARKMRVAPTGRDPATAVAPVFACIAFAASMSGSSRGVTGSQGGRVEAEGARPDRGGESGIPSRPNRRRITSNLMPPPAEHAGLEQPPRHIDFLR